MAAPLWPGSRGYISQGRFITSCVAAIRGQAIFKDDRDRERYLDFLKESQKRFHYRLYAYVLMGNHVHHLIVIVVNFGQANFIDLFGRHPLSQAV